MQDFLFSPALIAQAQAYFSPKYGRDISADEATGFLHSLADLYEQFELMVEAAPARLKAAGPATPQVPVTPVECCELQHDWYP